MHIRAPDVNALLPPDLSLWGMVQHADLVVKLVLAGLAVASLITWTIALAKGAEFVSAGRRLRAGLSALHAARDIGGLADQGGGAAFLVRAARDELAASGRTLPEGIKERTAWKLERLVADAGRRLGRGTGLLATIGATAPFVGLFGTVWGIMNAFVGIARSQTTNLAVVAPGIAEALLATAMGLAAAIPAVVIYNLFARAAAGHKALLLDMSAEVMRLLSRDLDRASDARLRAAE